MYKKSVVFLVALAFMFSPALVGMVTAEGLYFEGIKPINYGQTARSMKSGLVWRFSFGGPKDYSKKKNRFSNEIYDIVNDLDSERITAIGLGVVAVAVIALIVANANKGARFG